VDRDAWIARLVPGAVLTGPVAAVEHPISGSGSGRHRYLEAIVDVHHGDRVHLIVRDTTRTDRVGRLAGQPALAGLTVCSVGGAEAQVFGVVDGFVQQSGYVLVVEGVGHVAPGAFCDNETHRA
jgi:hypothetical protein